MQKHGQEDHRAEPGGDQESGSDGHAVEEGMNGEAEQHGVARVRVADLFRMRLFTEMKVRREGVLEQVHQEKADQYKEQSVLAAEADRFGDDFKEGDRKHVTPAECQKRL